MTGNSSLRWGSVAPQAGLLVESPREAAPTDRLPHWRGPGGILDLSRWPVFLAVRPSRDPHA